MKPAAPNLKKKNFEPDMMKQLSNKSSIKEFKQRFTCMTVGEIRKNSMSSQTVIRSNVIFKK